MRPGSSVVRNESRSKVGHVGSALRLEGELASTNGTDSIKDAVSFSTRFVWFSLTEWAYFSP